MKFLKISLLSSALILSGISAAQTLPPPAFAGQTYWFGPGPSSYFVAEYFQVSGGYSEMYDLGPTWVVSQSGGPAFLNSSAGASNVQSVFTVSTNLDVMPYIYVDGYFGLNTRIAGYSSGSPFVIGDSRFFVVHNTPLNIEIFGFNDMVGPGGATVRYETALEYMNYANPGSYTGFSLGVSSASPANIANVNIDPADSGGILEVNIRRTVLTTGSLVAGSYTGTGLLRVSAI